MNAHATTQHTSMATAKREQAAAEALGAARGKYLSNDLITRVSEGAMGRGTKREHDAWLAAQIDEKGFKVPKATQRRFTAPADVAPSTAAKRASGVRARNVATPLDREIAKGRIKEGPQAHMYDIMKTHVRWIRKHIDGAVGTTHLTMAQVAQAVKNANKRNTSADQATAVLVILASRGELTMEWKNHGVGGKKDHDKLAAAAHTMAASGWMSTQEANTTVEAAKQAVTVMAERTLTILDFGMGYGGAYEGFARQAKAVGLDRERRNKGTKEGLTAPDLEKDFASGSGDIVQSALKSARVSAHELLGVHFSPNCGPRCKIMSLDATNGDDRGEGANADKPENEEEVQIVAKIVEAIERLEKEAPAVGWTLEQPEGSSLAEDPAMLRLAAERVTVHQCSYNGEKWCKPTWVWTNLLPHWTPRQPKEHCRFCREKQMHEFRFVRRDANDNRSLPKADGFTTAAMKNRIPPDMAEEWAVAMKAKRVATLGGSEA